MMNRKIYIYQIDKASLLFGISKAIPISNSNLCTNKRIIIIFLMLWVRTQKLKTF